MRTEAYITLELQRKGSSSVSRLGEVAPDKRSVETRLATRSHIKYRCKDSSSTFDLKSVRYNVETQAFTHSLVPFVTNVSPKVRHT